MSKVVKRSKIVIDSKIKGEIYEMIDFVIDNDSELRKALKDKVVGDIDVSEIDKELKKTDSEMVRKILEEKRKEIVESRGRNLVKKYGKLLLVEKRYNKLMK